ncbi:hypothetical protein [Streptosporangium carneum]|uniref:WD40 repeat domain-containing protein n=1 Tax=Streptosporangium carneum TaxID=47481 RepID=A0A9W6MHN8_9ACTN|nr:hypothetical protein [Streptosporangium carneum]GLK14395.1 hypothetical protein GCM10017600_78070 [Streptosporangium carneum]
MTPKRGLAVLTLAAAAAATMTMTVTPAEAKTGAASADSVRYAWLDSCPKKDYTIPCGKWTLTLRSGKTVKLADARVNPRQANGKIDKEAGTPFAVSGDGRFVNYFKGDKLVVRDVNSGKVRPLPGGAAVLPRGIGQTDVDTTLSFDGSLVVVDYFDSAEKLPTLIVNLKNGKTIKLPPANNVLSFSPDGQHLLTGRTTDDNVTEFAVFDADGRETASQVVPQIVSNNSPVALANDGSTVALVITGASNTSRLRTYDLASDTVSDALPLGIPKDESAQRIYWDPAGTLTLWTGRNSKDGEISSAVKRTVNAETGSTRKLDSFTTKNSPWTWWLPGE